MNAYMDVQETRVGNEGPQLLRAAEGERRAQACGCLRAQIAIERLGERRVERLVIQAAPQTEGDPSSWHQHSVDLTQARRPVREELQPLVTARQIEGSVLE